MSRDRFTEKDDRGKVCVEIMPHEATEYVYNDLVTAFGHQHLLYGPALDKLAEYEDLVFSPLVLRAIIAEWKAWADAKNEGRLIILPCPAKTDIPYDGRTYHGDHWNGPILTAFADDPSTKSGKRGYLFSVTEVEAALQGGVEE